MAQLKNKLIGVAALAFAVTLGAGVWTANVNAQAEVDWTQFKISATAVRLGAGTQEDPSGLRFKVDCPVDYSANEEVEAYTTISFEYDGAAYEKNVPATVWRVDGSGWNAVLLDIPEVAYGTEITAQSYVVVDGQTYETATVSSSIAATALKAYNGGVATMGEVGKYIQFEAAVEKTYKFSDYTAGAQYAAEQHKLDDYVTLDINQCHLTSELRIYSSSSHNGVAIIKCDGVATGLTLNAGYKEDTLVVYGSNDKGATWTTIQEVATVEDEQDYTVNFDGASYQYIKLDVKGTQQVRVASMALTYKAIPVSDSVKASRLANNVAETLTVADKVYEAGTINLPTTEEENVTVEWTMDPAQSDFATLNGNVFTVVLPEAGAEDVEITLSAKVTAKVGTATESVDIDPITVTIVAPQVITSDPVSLAVFQFGANGSATHADGNTKTSYSETQASYTLSLTGGSQFYTGARDAKGNSCIKLGSSKNPGKFTLVVPDNVTKVIFNIAGYKANTAKVTINDTTTSISTLSNNGAYTAVEVDTTATKTISFTTASGGYRAMIDSIEFIGYAK